MQYSITEDKSGEGIIELIVQTKYSQIRYSKKVFNENY